MDVLSPSQRSNCMSRIRSRDTKPEISLRRALWGKGLRYRLKNRLPGRPDIVFTNRRIAIFVDGCFWHRCPIHGRIPESNRDFWENKLRDNTRRDADVTQYLKSQGWEVIRIWEHEISDDLGNIVNRILLKINQHD